MKSYMLLLLIVYVVSKFSSNCVYHSLPTPLGLEWMIRILLAHFLFPQIPSKKE
jgi:hypothetical protein